jgi:hypothetical protein
MNDKLHAATALHENHVHDIRAKYAEMEAFFGEISNKLTALQPYQDSGFSIDEVYHKFTDFKILVAALLIAPPPAPKVEEKQPESPWTDAPKGDTEEKPDVEMKTEEEQPPKTE